MLSFSSITISIGIKLRGLNNSLPANRRPIACLLLSCLKNDTINRDYLTYAVENELRFHPIGRNIDTDA